MNNHSSTVRFVYFRKHLHGEEYFPITEFDKEDIKHNLIDAKGGITLAYRRHNNKMYFAVSICHKLDNFNKKLDKLIATNRLEQFIKIHDDKFINIIIEFSL